MRALLSISLSLCLSVSTATAQPYAAWIAGYGLTGADAAADADPDHDRLSNLLEYVIDGCDPTASTAHDAPEMPVMGFLQRTDNNRGTWEWVNFEDRAAGTGGVWHIGMQWKVRAGVEGVRMLPQLADKSLRGRWFGGRSAWQVSGLQGNVIQAGTFIQANKFDRFFVRLSVALDDSIGDVFESLNMSGAARAELLVQSPTAVPRSLSSGSEVIVTQDLTIRRWTGATAVTDWEWRYAQSPLNPAPAIVQRSSSNPAVITPSEANPYLWTWISNGSATLHMHTSTSKYTAGVTASTSGGQVVDEIIGYPVGTLRAHVTAQIDGRLAGKTPATAQAIYTTQNHAAGSYTRNPNCWAAGVNLTPISPWNSAGANQRAGTLISPRHLLIATHFPYYTGTTVRFVTASNTVVTRTVTGTQALTPSAFGGPDVMVCLLDSDVPGTIGFCKILPANWASYLPTLTNLSVPVLALDQEEKALVTELEIFVSAGNHSAYMRRPVDALRLPFYEHLISGDSGNPGCLILNNELVLLTTWLSGAAGGGPAIHLYKSAINAAMTSLGGGYQLTEVDLSAFPSY